MVRNDQNAPKVLAQEVFNFCVLVFKATAATQSKKKRVFDHLKTPVDLPEKKWKSWKNFLRDFRKSMPNKEVCRPWGKSKMSKMNNNFATFGHQKVKIFTTLFTFMGLDLANLCDSFARFGSTQHEKKWGKQHLNVSCTSTAAHILQKSWIQANSLNSFLRRLRETNRNVHFKGTAFLASWEIAFVFIF